jgi:hypothetical protein
MNICLSWRRSSRWNCYFCVSCTSFFVCAWSLTILGRKTEKSEDGLKAVADRRLLESLFDSSTPGQSCMSLRDEIDWGLWLEDGDVGEDVDETGWFIPLHVVTLWRLFCLFLRFEIMSLVRMWRERADRVESDVDIVKTDWYVAIRSSSALVHFTRRRRERQNLRRRSAFKEEEAKICFWLFDEFAVYTKERLYYHGDWRRELHLRLDLLAMYIRHGKYRNANFLL